MSTPPYSVDSLESLLRSLSLSEDTPDHHEILKHANNVLKSSKENPRALHTKVVALLNLDHHEDALKILNSVEGRQLEGIAAIEKAYCLYKVGKLQEAVELTNIPVTSRQSERALKHIAAQAYYRLEDFVEASKICDSLANSKCEGPNEDGDLRVNITATNAQLHWSGQSAFVSELTTSNGDLDVFEETFNMACVSIARGDDVRGAMFLRRASELCNALEDLTEEEKRIELEPVIAQQIYLLAKTSHFDHAKDLSQDLDPENISDEALKVIATINQIAVKSQLDDYNPYLAYKIYKHAIDNATSLAARPFNFQSKIMDLNDSILNLDIGKTNATISNVKDYQIKYPSDDSINVVSAAAHVTNKTGKAVFTRLETMFKSNPKDVGLALILVQLCMSSGNITGATWILELLLTSLEPEKRYQPGLIGLLVAMYKHQGRSRHVRNLLSEASKWWMESPNPNLAILRAAGLSKIESEIPSERASARELFSKVLDLDPTDRISAAGLVASCVGAEPPVPTDSLMPLETLIAEVDISSLESAGAAQAVPKRGAEDEAGPRSRTKKARKRKPRMPKEYDASKQPDPERWLPLRDRSYYKPKGKPERKKAAASTQGGAVEESMELAGGDRVDVVKVDQAKKAAGNKQKKKKGGKR